MSATTTTSEHAATSTEPGWRLHLQSHVVRGALAMIVVQLSFRAWATYGSWYTGDDFLFISRMLSDGAASAFREYAGHLMPAPMLLSWMFNEASPFDWRVTATFLLLLQAMASWGLLRLLLALFGPRAGILAPLALYLFTVFSVPISIWWAAGANQLPLQIALFFGLTGHVNYLRTRRARHLGAAVGWVCAGLLFYEKTILVLGVYGIVTLCYFASGGVRSRALTVWSRFRGAHLTYAVLGMVYLAVYARYALTFAPGRAAEFPVAPTFGNLVVRVWVTGLFGGPLHWAEFGRPTAVADPSDLAVAICAALLVLLVRELHRTRHGSLRALLIPGLFLCADVTLVVAGRSSFVGSLIALDVRYQGESGALAAIGLACATMPILGSVEQPVRGRVSEFLDRPRLVAAACVVISLSGTYSSVRHVQSWNSDHRAERYFSTLKGEIKRLPPGMVVVDDVVPDFVTWAAAYPLNTLSHMLRQYHLDFRHVSHDELRMVDPDGRLVPAFIPPVRVATDHTSDACSYRVQQGIVTVQLSGPLLFGGWWVRIGYTATAESPVVVSAGGTTHHTMVRKGLHSLYLRAGDDEFSSIRLSGLKPGVTLCTSDITVGRPEPYRAELP